MAEGISADSRQYQDFNYLVLKQHLDLNLRTGNIRLRSFYRQWNTINLV